MPRRIAAGFLACAAPDLDFVVGFLGPVQYLELHRGPTHSLILLPAWALAFSWVLALVLRERRGWRAYYGVAAMGIALHIAGDVITSFGTMVLWPFSDWRAALGTTFIIDLWFSGIIVAGLVACALWRRTRLPAMAASAALVAYVGYQWTLKQEALELGRTQARRLGLGEGAVTAHPRPVTPHNWTVFVSDERAHRYAHVNLRRSEPRRAGPGAGFIARIDAPYLPASQALWVERTRFGHGDDDFARAAWQSQSLAFFRWFADLPAFAGETQEPRCAWFVDLRFLTPGRDNLPFQFGACRESPGALLTAYERGSGGPSRRLP